MIDALAEGFWHAIDDFRRILRAIVGLAIMIALPFGAAAVRFALWVKRR